MPRLITRRSIHTGTGTGMVMVTGAVTGMAAGTGMGMAAVMATVAGTDTVTTAATITTTDPREKGLPAQRLPRSPAHETDQLNCTPSSSSGRDAPDMCPVMHGRTSRYPAIDVDQRPRPAAL